MAGLLNPPLCLAAEQVLDPLVEKQKDKFNKVQQNNKKRNTEWAGRSVT
jgi:hypothetical protein